MDRPGLYLYGFIPDVGAKAPDLRDVEGIEGIGPPRTLAFGDLSAVVSDAPSSAFEAATEGIPDPAWLVPRALRHERVLSVVLDRWPVLPARFGTLFSSAEALAELVARHRPAILEFFGAVGDRREWSLRGYFDPEAAIDRLLEVDPDLAARRRALPEAPGARYFAEKKLREDARKAARAAAAWAADAARKAIREVVAVARSLPPRSAEGPGREMVLHEAALVDRGREAEALASAREAADAAIPGLLTLEPTGPFPPFHFCPELAEAPG